MSLRQGSFLPRPLISSTNFAIAKPLFRKWRFRKQRFRYNRKRQPRRIFISPERHIPAPFRWPFPPKSLTLCSGSAPHSGGRDREPKHYQAYENATDYCGPGRPASAAGRRPKPHDGVELVEHLPRTHQRQPHPPAGTGHGPKRAERGRLPLHQH